MRGVGGRRWMNHLEDYLEPQTDVVHYWHIQRFKRGQWRFVMELFNTKREVAGLWNRVYRGKKEFRLRHLATYGKQ